MAQPVISQMNATPMEVVDTRVRLDANSNEGRLRAARGTAPGGMGVMMRRSSTFVML
jgi:hypothetical protein